MATQRLVSTNSNVTPIQPVQYLPTRCLPKSGNEGKAFIIESKMNVLYTSKKNEHKVTTRDSLPNSGSPPDQSGKLLFQSQRQLLTNIVLILTLPELYSNSNNNNNNNNNKSRHRNGGGLNHCSTDSIKLSTTIGCCTENAKSWALCLTFLT